MADSPEQGMTQFTPQSSAGTVSADVAGPAAQSFQEGVKLAALQEATQQHSRALDLQEQQHKQTVLTKATEDLIKAGTVKGPARRAIFQAAQQGLAKNGINISSDYLHFLDADPAQSAGVRQLLVDMAKDGSFLKNPEIVGRYVDALGASGADIADKLAVVKQLADDQSTREKLSLQDKMNAARNATSITVGGLKGPVVEQRTNFDNFLKIKGISQEAFDALPKDDPLRGEALQYTQPKGAAVGAKIANDAANTDLKQKRLDVMTESLGIRKAKMVQSFFDKAEAQPVFKNANTFAARANTLVGNVEQQIASGKGTYVLDLIRIQEETAAAVTMSANLPISREQRSLLIGYVDKAKLLMDRLRGHESSVADPKEVQISLERLKSVVSEINAAKYKAVETNLLQRVANPVTGRFIDKHDIDKAMYIYRTGHLDAHSDTLNANPPAVANSPAAAPATDPKAAVIAKAKAAIARGVTLDAINQTLKKSGVVLTPQDVQ